jgi:cellobiose phosphorylase
MKNILSICLFTLVLVSCQTNSLQSFMVDNKSDDNFISIDFSLRTFVDNFDNLPEDQKQLFEDINKVNFLAFRKNESNSASYDVKREQLLSILSNEFEGNQLMSVNAEEGLIKMYADEIENNAEEIIIFASSDDKGFMVFRLLGDNLNPANFYKMMQMTDQLDFDSLANLVKMD